MKPETINVRRGERIWSGPAKTPYSQIVAELEGEEDKRTILVKEDGVLRELFKSPYGDCEVELISTAHQPGRHTVERSTCMLLHKAISDVTGLACGKEQLLFTWQGAWYYVLPGETPSEEFLQKVEARMRELVGMRIPFVKKQMSRRAAMRLFSKRGMTDKELLFSFRISSVVNVYFLEDYADYYYGFMVPDTGYIGDFALERFQEGFLLRQDKNVPLKKPLEGSMKLFAIQDRSKKLASAMGVSTVAELNRWIVSDGIERVMLASEALHEAQISEMADMILSRPSVRLVMIAGPSSSGKTSFSHRLSIQLAARGKVPHPIALDNYFLDRRMTPLDEFGEKNFEALEALDLAAFDEDMNRLLAGETVELPTYNFLTGQREYRGDYLKLKEEDILILEGIHALNDRLSASLPKDSRFRIYISALTQLSVDDHNTIPTTDGRLLRRITRDARTRGYCAADTIRLWPSVRRGEEKNIFPHQDNSDVLFNSALLYEFAALKVYAEPLLFAVSPSDPAYVEAKRLLKFLDYFVAVPSERIPMNSLLREFVGGSIFKV